MNKNLSKIVFYSSLLMFMALQVFGFFHADARIVIECPFLFGVKQIIIPQLRYAYILNKFLVIPAEFLHVPMAHMALVCCINDCLFYLAVAFLIIHFTYRYDYAAAVLIAPLILYSWSFFYLVLELFQSGALMVLFFTVYKYGPYGLKRMLILLPCAFFIIWSQPCSLMLMPFFLAAAYTSLAQVKKNWFVLLFCGINTILRVILFTGSDTGKISVVANNVSYAAFINNFSLYMNSFWFMPLACLIIFFISRAGEQRKSAFICLTGYIIVLPILFSKTLLIVSTLGKVFYPLHLFIMVQIIMLLCSKSWQDEWVILILLLFLGNCIRTQVGEITGLACNSVEKEIVFYKRVNEYCAKLDYTHSKWFVKNEHLINKHTGIIPGGFHASMFLSAVQGQATTVQVLYADSLTAIQVNAVREDELYSGTSNVTPISSLDSSYFHIQPGLYRELNADSVCSF